MGRSFMSDIKELIPDQQRQDQNLVDHNNDPSAHPGLGAEVLVYGERISGIGNVWDDLNAYDFTGHPYAVGDSLDIKTNALVVFGHLSVSYIWVGPKGVLVGGTQPGRHIAVEGDLSPIGTADHAVLLNRDAADGHPIAAVTGLQVELDQKTTDLNNHKSGGNEHPDTSIIGLVTRQNTQDAGIAQNAADLQAHKDDPGDPHPQYTMKQPLMALGGSANSFALNTTDSKLENYSLSGEQHTSGSVDPINGEITIPEDGLYHFMTNVLGLQGNDTKEEWIELKLDVAGVDRVIVGFLDVTTDKTSTRQLVSFGTRQFTAGQVLSLYMWASAGLGTFTVTGTAFEVSRIAD